MNRCAAAPLREKIFHAATQRRNGSHSESLASSKLLYIGDVPVEASYHGSALLHRLLSNYPPDNLQIVETATQSQPERRLPGVKYKSHPIGNPRWLNTRFHPYAVAWFTHSGNNAAPRIAESIDNFNFDAVLTVTHGFGWLAAAEVAKKRKLPLHLVTHDDWPRVANIAPQFRNWLDERFASVYRQAHSRFCISPAMSRFYEQHYGAPATVIYPSRAANCPDYSEPPPQKSEPFTVAFAGTINSNGYIQALIALKNALKPLNGRLSIFGPLTPDEAHHAGLSDPNTRVRGLLSADQLLTTLREEADALFVPMSFDECDRSNMEMAFPSKLADYTATGLPLLIFGPGYCSAVAWARANNGVAEIAESPDTLNHAVTRLANDPDHRLALGTRALEVGREYFHHARAQQAFDQALASVKISV